jgi:hypothetical protein
MPVRWSQALNFQIFLTLIKQHRNSEETDFPHRKMAAENMRRSDIAPAGPALPSAKRSTGRFSLHASKSATWENSPLQAWDAFGYLQILAYAEWLKHNSNSFMVML